MAATRHVVVVVTAESTISERLAEKLRGTFAVRTAYDGESLERSLDETVDVVLLDPATPGVDPDEFATRLRDREFVCQFGLLTAEEVSDPAEPVDTALEPTTPRDELERVVARMAARAVYRSHLERLYDLATKRAAIASTNPDDRTDSQSAELSQLDGQIEQLRGEIAEALDRLDDQAAFEAALQFIDDPDGDSD